MGTHPYAKVTFRGTYVGDLLNCLKILEEKLDAERNEDTKADLRIQTLIAITEGAL